MPRISVLMPVRDAGPYLTDALDSVLAQTEPDLELIAVDDGSSDGSRQRLEAAAAADPRVRLLKTAVGSRGLLPALELGLDAVRAPLVARMDADDISEPDRLARLAAELATEPGLFAVCSRVEAFPESELGDGMRRYLDWQNSLLEPAELERDRFVESPLVHPSAMMRTEGLDRLGGWRDMGWAEDWDLWLRAMEAGFAIARVEESLYRWRLHPRRATLTDPRYSAANFLRCRVHFLARHLGTCDRSVWVMGAGPTGKALAKSLAGQDCRVSGFAEVDRAKIGGLVDAAGQAWPVIDTASLLSMEPRPIAIAAVGQAGGRRQIRAELVSQGWIEGEDFLVAA